MSHNQVGEFVDQFYAGKADEVYLRKVFKQLKTPDSVDNFFSHIIADIINRGKEEESALKFFYSSQLAMQNVILPFCNDIYNSREGMEDRFVDVFLSLEILRGIYGK